MRHFQALPARIKTTMTVEDFIAAQIKIIREGRFDGNLPVLWVETPSQVRVEVLMEELEADEIELAARDWAQKLAGEHDYFLAFRADESHLMVVSRIGTQAANCLAEIRLAETLDQNPYESPIRECNNSATRSTKLLKLFGDVVLVVAIVSALVWWLLPAVSTSRYRPVKQSSPPESVTHSAPGD